MNAEEWRDVVGYEGFYKVSNLGNVKSVRYDKILKKIPLGGYRHVHLSVSGEAKHYNIHRLVAQAFIPNPNNYAQVNHIDFDKTNNNVNNLQWVTCQQNIDHSQSNRLHLYKVTKTEVENIFLDAHLHGKTIKQISLEKGLTWACVRNIVNRKTWLNVTQRLSHKIWIPAKPMIIDGVEWKDIEGYEGKYRISSRGEVFSIRTNKILKPGVSNRHHSVILRDNGKYQTLRVHRLVAKAFIPNPDNLPIIHHIDHNAFNNRVENLEWCHQSHNMKKAREANRLNISFGTKNGNAKLDESSVKLIRALYKQGGESYMSLGRRFNVHCDTIRQIVKRYIWQWVEE